MYSLQWYLLLLTLGIIFIPFTKKLFGSFADYGYPFAKTIAIIFISYSVFALGILKLLPYSWLGIVTVTVVLGYLNWRVRKKLKITKTMVFEEVLFLVSFLFLGFVRSQEPSIHGLEKFMDFGFMQSILKSTYFPPADMWYSPEPINYYYFGHLTGATLIKLSTIPANIGYNLILATIFGLSITQTFSLVINLIGRASDELKAKISQIKTILFGLTGTILLNLAGNLHTIYFFTKGYPNDKPIEFWKIFSGFNPTAYWYPNATRFIPFTIHEFPSYSYVVADLHGHVFDIPFVLLTIALLFVFFTSAKIVTGFRLQVTSFASLRSTLYDLRYAALFGFLTAIHYMTNAFDGPIYLLLVFGISYFVFRNLKQTVIFILLTSSFFILFSLPFTLFFKPFATGIGVNCAPQFLVQLQKLGPFLFERGNCQTSPFWMMILLWGQFWISLAVLLWITRLKRSRTDLFVLICLAFSFVLVWIPEFIYAKDIYPAHFRANTLFKLGYQAYILSSFGIIYVLFRLSHLKLSLPNTLIRLGMCVCLFLLLLYPLFSFQSFYGKLDKTPELDGFKWLEASHPQSAEIVKFLNTNVKEQVNILEAQGDSYSDFNVVSSYTGNPTIAGWYVHEWLWRGSSQVVQSRLPDFTTLYESKDIEITRQLLKKYNIEYVVVTTFEREKYKNLYETKFQILGHKLLNTKDGFGALYSVKQ